MKDPKDPSYDPLYRQLTVRLESLPRDSKSFAVTKGKGGYVVWYYDPTNRIMSPGIEVFGTLEEMTAQLVASLLGNHDDDPRIKETLEKALEWAELAKLEFHVKVLSQGGYTVKDPALRVDGNVPKDLERAEELRAHARYLRKKLELQP